MSDDEDSYGLVFPFIVCASEGGPYDDRPTGSRWSESERDYA